MSKPIYILTAVIEMDLGCKWTQDFNYFWYFENYADAESEIEKFEDKAVRHFKMIWNIDEDSNDFKIETKIKELHLYKRQR
jgi:hypothetical protein